MQTDVVESASDFLFSSTQLKYLAVQKKIDFQCMYWQAMRRKLCEEGYPFIIIDIIKTGKIT